ncbi:F-box only protein 16 [Patella vulgata]|uniref:F-box only protein 16 n=1 Tax=Patella vulgata TaxID=6465 RepID=UPI00217FA35D|nr:F-box only protein 16 [Patella vulgata]
MSMRAKNRMKSSWTPLSDGATNNKLYEERRGLVTKWFDRWTDDQRKKVFDELIRKCKPKQLDYLRCVVNDRAPVHRQDFTSVLPRVISLYIFSFLDPRSLSRSSQVCWYWKFLTELDVLWMAKCLRLGWYLTYTPSPYETGMWKKNYIEHIQSLQALRPQSPSIKHRMNNLSPRGSRKGGRDGGVGGVGGGHGKDKNKTPWRGSDPVPTDTYRYNILDNNDVIEEINKQ